MSKRYPWYDSGWLELYVIAKDFIRRSHPEKLHDFVHAFDVFRTDPAFSIKKVAKPFDESIVSELKAITKKVDVTKAPDHELSDFGRFVVYDEPYADKLQDDMTGLVSELVGEQVEPCYNFLSLYWEMGVCGVHMDAPFAKWTLDYCIEQSDVWPIHFSKIVPWPESGIETGEGWQDKIKSDPENKFESYEMQEGEALIFSGCSQWHYREPIERRNQSNFCNLLFFHYIPAGTSELTKPVNWKDLFDIPELAGLENPTDYPL